MIKKRWREGGKAYAAEGNWGRLSIITLGHEKFFSSFVRDFSLRNIPTGSHSENHMTPYRPIGLKNHMSRDDNLDLELATRQDMFA
eukprot:gene12738-14044_t